MTPLSKWQRLGQSLATQRQFAAHARRMAPGSLGGRTESASPAPRSAAPVVWSGTAPGAPAAGPAEVMSLLIGDPTGGTAAGNGSNVIVPFTDLSSSTHGTPDIVPTTPAGSWTLPAGIYIVSAQVRWDTLGGVRELRLAGSALPAFVPVKLQVAAAATEETVLAVSSGAFHVAASGDVRVLARQTSGGAGTVFGERLTIVRLAPYVYTP